MSGKEPLQPVLALVEEPMSVAAVAAVVVVMEVLVEC